VMNDVTTLAISEGNICKLFMILHRDLVLVIKSFLSTSRRPENGFPVNAHHTACMAAIELSHYGADVSRKLHLLSRMGARLSSDLDTLVRKQKMVSFLEMYFRCTKIGSLFFRFTLFGRYTTCAPQRYW